MLVTYIGKVDWPLQSLCAVLWLFWLGAQPDLPAQQSKEICGQEWMRPSRQWLGHNEFDLYLSHTVYKKWECIVVNSSVAYMFTFTTTDDGLVTMFD